jgi:uncharacterized membrane protein YhaH (DUF805 family)
MNLGNVLFSPNGRIGQQEYWIGVLIIIGGNVLLSWIPFLGFLISIGLIYVGVCVYGKRLHDMGKTAWIHGIVWLIQIVLIVIGFTMAGGAIMAAMANGGGSDEANLAAFLGASSSVALFLGLGFLIWVVYTIWVGVSAGEAGDNRFGPAPGAVAAAAAAPAAPAAPAQPAATPETPEAGDTPGDDPGTNS